MIQKLSHVTLFVRNQDEAKDFYVNKLGFKVHTDHTMDNGFRWLTVVAPLQPDLEIVLIEPVPGPMLDEESVKAVRLLLSKGVLGAGAFEVDAERRTMRSRARVCSSKARLRSASMASKRFCRTVSGTGSA
jgi:catechol 2,3-dioxygenase-like lactoylglutathione lyase family enzyme